MLRTMLVWTAGVLCGLFLVAADARAAGWQTFRSDSGWTSFAYPTGWEVIATDRSASRYLENYAVQPRGQDFRGASGQAVFRIFDPMYVIEEARVPTGSSYDTVFRRFVQSLPGGRGATFGSRNYEGRSYFFAEEYSEGLQVSYVGVVSSSGGYLSVIGLAAGPRDYAAYQTLLFQIAGSMKIPGPKPDPAGAEIVVSQWYAYLKQGNTNALMSISCERARGAMAMVWLGGLALGGGDTLQGMTQAARGFDFSGLRYQIVQGSPTVAAVRVSGNVIGPNGSITPFHQYARGFGGSNTFVVRAEGGYWKICGPLRGGNR